MLSPSEVRTLNPTPLDHVAPKLKVARTFVALPWIAWREIQVEDLAKRIGRKDEARKRLYESICVPRQAVGKVE